MKRMGLISAILAMAFLGALSCSDERLLIPERNNPYDRNNPVTGGMVDGTFEIDSGAAYTTSRTVDLSLHMSYAAEMKLSNVTDFSGAPWQPYATTVTEWLLSEGEGVKTVYAKFKNDFGVESASINDAITLDQTGPTVTGMSPTPVDGVSGVDWPLILSWTPASDALSGVAGYQVYLDKNASPTMEIYSGISSFCPTDGLSSLTLYHWRVIAIDGAGNEAPSKVWSFTTDVISEGFVWIRAGTFEMGSPLSESGRGSDEDLHTVTLNRDFLMQATEVSQAEYLAVMGTNPSYFSGSNRPVESISWYDAIAYCNAKSAIDGLVPAYEGSGTNWTWNQAADGWRLPTEAEWEYACRASTTTRFSSGDTESDLSSVGWYSGNSVSRTHDNRSKPANAWGLYDMHGNVYEWCWDYLGDYGSGNQSDPTGPNSGFDRVFRGGCWNNGANFCRSADRFKDDPLRRGPSLGFRVVRSSAQ